MRAYLLTHTASLESHPLRVAGLPDPTPAPGQVRIKVRCCATCRTDLHIIEGDLGPLPVLPITPGHQIVGTIDALAPDVTQLSLGDRVGIAWLQHTDGRCRFCLSARENLCDAPTFTGYHVPGGYAQYACAPADFVYPLPAHLDDPHAAPLLCAGIVGYRALKRADLPPGGRLAIFGFGSSAHLMLQLAVARGHPVYVVSRAAVHQQLALDLGAAWAGDDASRMPDKVDSVILFAPSGKLVPAALACLDKGGTLSLAGIHMSPIPELDYDRDLFNERDIHPVTANTRTDAHEFLRAAADVSLRPHIQTYDFTDLPRALADLKSDAIKGTGVLMVS